MIVDDSERVRQMITFFIDDLVDEFVECADGSEAVAAYSGHRPDLVLMDLQMKEVDGLKATREIKEAFFGARVVIVSQWDSPALREAAKRAGAEDYVNKTNLMPLRVILEKAQAETAGGTRSNDG
jgi:CheY-like chemotaxis protein